MRFDSIKGGLSFQVFEASDGVGGRVRTDRVEGFLLDRGFQVLLTAYPEARRVLDYDALHLRPFYPGALIRLQDLLKFVQVSSSVENIKTWHRSSGPWSQAAGPQRPSSTGSGDRAKAVQI